MRVANRVLALLFGLGVGATCLLGALEATAAFVDRGPVLVPYDRWIKWAQAFRWSSPQVASLSAAVAGVGLILLVMQLLPRRPLTLRTLLEGPNVEVEVDRRALEHSLARAASGVDGVHKAGVKAGKTRVRVTIEAPAGNDN